MEEELEVESIPPSVYTEEDDKDIIEGIDEDHPWKSMYHHGLYYLEDEVREKEWVIEGLVAKGTTLLLGGSPKSGKSFLALDFGVSVALGRSVLGDFSSKKGKVLYLSLEDDEDTIAERVQQMVDGKPRDLKDNFHVIHECPRWHTPVSAIDGQRVIASWIVDNQKDAALIVVDTLQMMRPAESMGGGYNNDYNSVIGFRRMAHKTGIPFVIVHHTTKSSNKGNWMSAFSGSYGLTGGVDDLSVLIKERKGSAKLNIGGRKVGEEQKHFLSFEKSSLRWVAVNDPSSDDEDDDLGILTVTEAKILEVLFVADSSTLPLKEIHRKAGLNENTVKSAIRKLVQKHRIIRVQPGWYKFNDALGS